ncbi:MAG TPA: hypothetical protein VF885_14470 [Arthrobacter sp.]
MPRNALPAGHPVYEQIMLLCLDAVEDEIFFEPLFDKHVAVLSVTGTLSLDLYQDTVVTVWAGSRSGKPDTAEDALWIRIASTMPADGVSDSEIQELRPSEDMLGLDLDSEDAPEWVLDVAEHLLMLLMVAAPTHEGLTGAARIRSFIQLNNAAQEGILVSRHEEDELDEEDDHQGHDDGNPNHKPWHHYVDDFAQQCRLGFLFHVAVQESPHGGFDISSETYPPTLGKPVSLKVFMHQGATEDLPSHWFAADDASGPAHGQGEDAMDGILGGYPADARGFIGHSLEHLHRMGHLVQNVAEAKIREVLEMTSLALAEREVPSEITGLLVTEAVADSLAGLNGIARLHTGTAELPIPGGVRG